MIWYKQQGFLEVEGYVKDPDLLSLILQIEKIMAKHAYLGAKLQEIGATSNSIFVVYKRPSENKILHQDVCTGIRIFISRVRNGGFLVCVDLYIERLVCTNGLVVRERHSICTPSVDGDLVVKAIKAGPRLIAMVNTSAQTLMTDDGAGQPDLSENLPRHDDWEILLDLAAGILRRRITGPRRARIGEREMITAALGDFPGRSIYHLSQAVSRLAVEVAVHAGFRHGSVKMPALDAFVGELVSGLDDDGAVQLYDSIQVAAGDVLKFLRT